MTSCFVPVRPPWRYSMGRPPVYGELRERDKTRVTLKEKGEGREKPGACLSRTQLRDYTSLACQVKRSALIGETPETCILWSRGGAQTVMATPRPVVQSLCFVCLLPAGSLTLTVAR